MITTGSETTLGLKAGDAVCALVKATHVIPGAVFFRGVHRTIQLCRGAEYAGGCIAVLMGRNRPLKPLEINETICWTPGAMNGQCAHII
jgi:hypothetical protein